MRGVPHLPRRHQEHAAALLQRLQDIQKLLRQVREGNSWLLFSIKVPHVIRFLSVFDDESDC